MKLPEKFNVRVKREPGSTEVVLVVNEIVHKFAVPDALLGQAWGLAKTLFAKKAVEADEC